MDSLLIILIAIAMFSVLGVLIVGIVGFIQGGEFNKKYGNKLMQARVILQGIAIALLAIAFFAYHK